MKSETTKGIYDLSGRVAIITGGAGMLGVMHTEAIAEAGGCPVLADINEAAAVSEAKRIAEIYGVPCLGVKVDITSKEEVQALCSVVLERYGRIDILINNAANDPKVKPGESSWSRFENFTLEQWSQDIAVGLTGAFLCSRVIGGEMARRGGGVILNIASDLGVIAPDQRIYAKDGLSVEQQAVKPVSYSVVKHALIGLAKYLATYWAEENIRVNVLSPGGVQADQPKEFIEKFSYRVPMGRMARRDEYKGAVLFLVSDASSYMTGANLIIDGGKTCW